MITKFIEQYFTGIIGALSIMTAAYVVFWVLFGKKLGNRKIQLSKRAGWSQIKGEIITSAISFLGSTLFMLVILYYKDSGLTKFYTETGKYGWWYEPLTLVVMILISDAWFYWCHRAMHHQSVYKYVHALHHKSLDVNPYTSTSFHAIEAVVLTLWVLPLVMVMPISMSVLSVMQVVGTFNNLKSHLGFELFPGFFKHAPFNMLVTATNHSMHHTQYNGNYGLFFRFWDLACNTELSTTTATFTEIHNRENQEVIDNTTYRKLTIEKLVKETKNTVSVYFTPEDIAFYNYQAGQYLTTKVKVKDKTYDRCFSLSSSPEDPFLRITVKLKGEVSNYFYHHAKVGDQILSLLPVGEFTLKPSINKNYVMVAGGSGITPIFSMVNSLLQNSFNGSILLLYANTDAETIIFKEALDGLQSKFPNFKVAHYISGKNRISKQDLVSQEPTDYYICGPENLKKGINQHLKNIGIAKENIHQENFADGYVPWFGLF
jgi:ring-1,2-phenylacetyl-CoA epoxidase subunit PaaE